MNKTTKIILIIVGALMLICVFAVGVSFAVGAWSVARVVQWADTNTTRDLYEVAPMINEIAVITLPDGYGSPYGMHIGEITSVGFSSPSKNTHIMLTQFPHGTIVNAEETSQLLTKYSADSDNRWNGMQTRVIEQRPVSIRGQETTLTISEGTSSDGTTYRTAFATFQGNGGPAFVMIAGTLDEWNIEMINTFIASIQ